MVTTALLIAGGAGYRTLGAYLGLSDRAPLGPIKLPSTIAGWQGTEDKVPEDIGSLIKRDWDQFLSRVYQRDNRSVRLYMACGTNVWKLIRHKVDTCYVLGGWTLTGRQEGEIAPAQGAKVRCTVFHFAKGPRTQTVLSYYLADGQSYPNTSFWHRNILPPSFEYVANVQISWTAARLSPSREEVASWVRDFATASATHVRAAMPGETQPGDGDARPSDASPGGPDGHRKRDKRG